MTFKFFRQYNKLILIIGVSLLMFVFLIQGTLMPSANRNAGGTQVIGTLKGVNVTASERVDAAQQLIILNQFFPGLGPYLGDESSRALKWLLIKKEAQSFGLHASSAQIDSLMKQGKIEDAAGLVDAAAKFDTTTDTVREAFRSMAIFMDYNQLVSGGGLRLSGVEIDHVLADVTSRAKVKVVLLTAQRNLPNAAEPTDKALGEFFEKYKDTLPGKSKPYGIGFMIPNRAKIEYLAIPGEQVRAKVSVDEVEALAFYDAKKQFFTEPAPQGQTQPSEPKVKSYDEVAPTIRKILKQQKSEALADRIVRTAAGILAADANGLPETDGFKVLPADFKATPLSTVAQKIQQQFGILPDVVRLEDRWMDKAAVSGDMVLGHAMVQGMQNAKAADYLFSAKEFTQDADAEHPFASLRFQAGLVSQPLMSSSYDGSRYLVRLSAAQAARVPKSLDEVRPEVIADAKLLNSYQNLKDSQADWLAKFSKVLPEAFAADLKLKAFGPQPFARRDFAKPGAPVTQVEGVGGDPAFVNKVFDLAENLHASGGIETASPSQRSFVVPLDSTMTLALVQLESVEPMARTTFDMLRSNPQIAMRIQQILGGEAGKTLSLAAIAKRIGYVGKNGEESNEKAPSEQSQPFDQDDQGM